MTRVGRLELPELPRIRLLEGPTPLQPMERLGAALGGRADLWIKREDVGPLPFSGPVAEQQAVALIRWHLEATLRCSEIDAQQRAAILQHCFGHHPQNRDVLAFGDDAGIEFVRALAGEDEPEPVLSALRGDRADVVSQHFGVRGRTLTRNHVVGFVNHQEGRKERRRGRA